MNIVVCIKQVPDVDDIKWTKENNLDRMNMLSKINPHDEWALDWAMNIKTKFKDVHITAISMGPKQAEEVLFQAVAKGADRAILLSDRAFIGSDTLVTSKILASAISKFVPDFDLIITGQLACDGDTAQVPIGLAQILNIPDINQVDEIVNADKNCAIISQKLDDVVNIFEISTPCLVAVKEPCKNVAMPKIDDYIKAQQNGIETYGIDDLDLDKNETGVIGSPTLVWKAYRPEFHKETQEIKEDFSKNILDLMLKVR